MTGVVAYFVIGILLPVAAGLAIARALFPSTEHARWSEWIGMALLIGPVGASMLMHLLYWDTTLGAIASVAILSLAGALAWRAGAAAKPAPGPRLIKGPLILVIAASVAFILVAAQLAGLALEVAWRPTFPWDAWAAWGHKAKAWFHAETLPEFVNAAQWAEQSGPGVYSVTAPHYPTLVAGYQVFLATCLGQWHEPSVNTPWLMVHASLFLLLYGEAVRISNSRAPAVLLASLVMSLPLIGTHTALAGYMDLWMALALYAFCVCVSRTADSPGARSLAMTVFLAVTLIGLKVEGLVWALVVIAAFGILWASGRVAVAKTLSLEMIMSVLVAVGLATATVAAWTDFQVAFPYVGDIRFGLNADWPKIALSLFASWNWHLFFPALMLCLVLDALSRHKCFVQNFWRLVSVFGLLTIGVLIFLVQVNEASTNMTNYNRLLLQWIPVWATYGFAVVSRLGAPEPVVVRPSIPLE